MAIDRTARAIIDKAMYLIDAQGESNGDTDTTDTRAYRVRTVGILNNLLDVVYPASSNYRPGEDGSRPALDDITDLTDEVDLDPRLLRDVLPYGLASRLLSEEDPTLANFFEQLFEEHLAQTMHQKPAAGFEAIDGEEGGPYGGIEYGQFSRWS